MKIYLSGDLTNGGTAPVTDAKIQAFDFVEEQLKAKGYEVVSPIKLPHNHDKTWPEYMAEDLLAMFECQAIFMIHGWEQSKGACLEFQLAKRRGMNIFEQKFPGKFMFEVLS